MSSVPPPPKWLFAGPLPPPVHGQAIATSRLQQALTPHLRLEVLDTAAGGRGAWPRIGAHWALLRRCLERRGVRLYLSLNANAGMVLSVVIAIAVLLRGGRVVLHHHSFAHIRRARMILRPLGLAAERVLHLTQCPRMGALLQAQYGGWRCASLHNAALVDPALRQLPLRGAGPKLVLGHLANLSEEKGLTRALQAFVALRDAGYDAQLLLAGPAVDEHAQGVLRQACSAHPEHVRWMGPLNVEGKREFFAAIDVFLFPSLYRNETQGIVNLEAMAAGVPVIAIDQCCVGADIGQDGGAAVANADEFDAALLHFAAALRQDSQEAAARARRRFDELLVQADEDLQALLRVMGAADLHEDC